MLEYLALYYRLGNRTGKALDRFGVIDFATTIAPGLRDVLLTGKVYEAVERNTRNKNARVYDAVVLDAPPTGRIVAVPQRQRRARRPGARRPGPRPGRARHGPAPVPAHRGAPGHRARGHAGAGDRRRHRRAALARLPVGGVVVNLTRPQELDDDERDAALAGRVAGERGRAPTWREVGVDGRRRPARRAARRGARPRRAARARGRAARADRDARRPAYELTRLPDGIDLGGLYELAAELREQGMA